jgi:hypothetical protein
MQRVKGVPMSEALRHLAWVGVTPDPDGTVVLYHATRSQHLQTILDDKELKPALPADLAERQLRGGRGAVYLSSHPEIGKDMRVGPVIRVRVAARDLDSAEVVRSRYGTPPRIELEVWREPSAMLPLVSAEVCP